MSSCFCPESARRSMSWSNWSRNGPAPIGGASARRQIATTLEPDRALSRTRRRTRGSSTRSPIARRSRRNACGSASSTRRSRNITAFSRSRSATSRHSCSARRARNSASAGWPTAVASLEELKRRWPDYSSFDGHLLYARALEGAGRNDEALENYEGVGRYFPGAEPTGARGATAAAAGARRRRRAAIAEDVARTLTRAPAHVRRNQREWLAQAKQTRASG